MTTLTAEQEELLAQLDMKLAHRMTCSATDARTIIKIAMEQAAQIASLQSALASAEEALEPFADHAKCYDWIEKEGGTVEEDAVDGEFNITILALRSARDVLAQIKALKEGA